jgi:hypothetical protein
MITFDSSLIISNLTNPALLCFMIGAAAALLKSDLRVPSQVHETLSMYLLFSIGLKGGMALDKVTLSAMIHPLIMTLIIGISTPIIAYFTARYAGKISSINAAALAAHFGSVSAVTFMAAVNFATHTHVVYDGFLTALLVLLEIPGIVIALIIAGMTRTQKQIGLHSILHEALTGKSVLLLTGGLMVGLWADPKGLIPLESVFISPFQGILAFFLLEMGVVAALRLRESKKRLPFMLCYGTMMPLCFGLLSLCLGHYMDLAIGTNAILATMAASASYIAAPAAVKMALPEANPSLYLTTSISIALPFNLILGIPIYFSIAHLLAAHS